MCVGHLHHVTLRLLSRACEGMHSYTCVITRLTYKGMQHTEHMQARHTNTTPKTHKRTRNKEGGGHSRALVLLLGHAPRRQLLQVGGGALQQVVLQSQPQRHSVHAKLLVWVHACVHAQSGDA
jgi:hypothetical protein